MTQHTQRSFARANLLRTCYGLVVSVADLMWTCYGEVANLLRTCNRETGVMDLVCHCQLFVSVCLVFALQGCDRQTDRQTQYKL